MITKVSFVSGLIDIGDDEYTANRFKKYMSNPYEIAKVLPGSAPYRIRLDYMPSSKLKEHMPLFVENGNIEVMYRVRKNE